MNFRLPSLLALLAATAVHADAQFSGYANNGLVGVGSISANAVDATGNDTIGGIFSAMAFNQSSIQINTSGGNRIYSGVLIGQSDRGYNVDDTGITSDFHPRYETFSLTITPTTGSPGAEGQIQLTNNGATMYTDPKGNVFSGLDANSISTVAANGFANLPQSSSNNHLALDPEGYATAMDGSFYTSDEYGPIIYHFGANGVLLNTIVPPVAFTPIVGGSVNYSALSDPDSGRMANGGLEGLSITPDGQYLVAMMQKPIVQDGGKHLNSSGKTDAQNIRLLLFNLTGANAGQLAHEYVYTAHFNSGDHNKATGVSEVLALSSTKFLVLDRDTSGRGTANNNAPSYKAVVVIDTTSATDIAGTGFDKQLGASGALGLPVAALSLSGTSVSGFGTVVPVAQMDLVNLIDTTQLARFGQNVSADWNKNKDTIISNNNSVPEKLEGMTIIPENDPMKPNHYLLLVGSDNDYITQSGVRENGAIVPNSADTTLGTGETCNTKIYAYDVTLPGAAVLMPAVAAETPAMPTWGLILLGVLLTAAAATKLLPRRVEA